MSTIKDSNKIDLIGIDEECGYVNLEIIDTMNWHNEEEHLLLLQTKINTYLTFIESNEIYDKWPEAEGRKIVICIAFLETLTDNAMKFIFSVAYILDKEGYKLKYTTETPYKLTCYPSVM